MPEVMDHPARQVLAKRDSPQAGVQSGQLEAGRGQSPGYEQIEIGGAELGEFG
jgi:hypothetical protein